jgi:hypothetical protein
LLNVATVLTSKELLFFARGVYLWVASILRINGDYCVNYINGGFPEMETQCVYCEIGTEVLDAV